MAFVEHEEVTVRNARSIRSRVRSVAAGRRVAVIGGGLGGLAAALRLAHDGWEVTVFERHSRLGGKMNLIEDRGYRFDTGPTLITMPWVFEELFDYVGEAIEHHVQLIPVAPLCRYTFADSTTIEMTTRCRDWLPQIRIMEGGDASGFLRFLAMGSRVLELSLGTFFQRSPWERPRLSDLTAFSKPLPPSVLLPYSRVVSRLCKDPRTRQLLNRYTTYVGSDPSQTPSLMSVIPAMELLYGGFHIVGGLYRLVEALERLCRHRGVELRTNTDIRRIHVAGGRVRSVESHTGEIVPADVVVMNGDAHRLPRLLGRTNESAPRPEALSLSGIVLLFGVRGDFTALPHHQVFFSADYEREFRELFVERRFPVDPTVYVSIPTRTDRSMAPEGCEIVFVMANAPACLDLPRHDLQEAEQRIGLSETAGQWDEATVAEARSRILRKLEPSGLAAILEGADVEACVTPRSLAETYDAVGGAIYGTNAHGFRAFLRPPNRHRHIRGLYCVGGSTHPGGGTPMVLLSARIVSRLIAEHEHG